MPADHHEEYGDAAGRGTSAKPVAAQVPGRPGAGAAPVGTAPTATGHLGRRRGTAVLAVVCFAGVTASLLHTFVVPVVPDLPRLLSTTPEGASWVLVTTLLAGAVAMPVSGRLGDLFGKRRLLGWCLLMIVIGSVCCATADSLIPVLFGRFLQGLGMGAVSLGISLMRDLLPADRVVTGVGVVSATLGIGGAVALPLGGVLIERWGWHSAFWVAAGLGALCLLALYAVVPESPQRHRVPVDLPGIAGLALGVSALLIVASRGGVWGWGSARAIGLALGAVLVLVLWAWHELRRPEPLVDLRASATPGVRWVNLTGLLLGFGMYVLPLTFPVILLAPPETGYGLGRSVADVGLLLAPGGLAMMVAAPLSTRISRAHGARVTLALGGLCSSAGYLLVLFLPTHAWVLSAACVVCNAGVAFGYAAMPILIMDAVPVTRTAAANGLNALMRAFGLAVSGAVVGAVLTGATSLVDGARLPAGSAVHTALLLGVAAGLAGTLCAALVPRTPAP
ncbi:MFS transporter [Streptomyces triticisoli]|jgi:MFS family permease|uniref:MFS transporter n=1 Tax=Streptomyces triticisoli TaxID=2182797 RepID=UPI0013007950|nr:MFS transporter [Streptomyces triticisoli]